MYDIFSDLSNEILYMLFIIIINSLHFDEVICNSFMPSSSVYVTLIRYFPALIIILINAMIKSTYVTSIMVLLVRNNFNQFLQ